MLRERVEAYFGKLEKLSGDDLDRSAQAIVAIEKKDTARLIAHIAEIKSRDASPSSSDTPTSLIIAYGGST